MGHAIVYPSDYTPPPQFPLSETLRRWVSPLPMPVPPRLAGPDAPPISSAFTPAFSRHSRFLFFFFVIEEAPPQIIPFLPFSFLLSGDIRMANDEGAFWLEYRPPLQALLLGVYGDCSLFPCGFLFLVLPESLLWQPCIPGTSFQSTSLPPVFLVGRRRKSAFPSCSVWRALSIEVPLDPEDKEKGIAPPSLPLLSRPFFFPFFSFPERAFAGKFVALRGFVEAPPPIRLVPPFGEIKAPLPPSEDFFIALAPLRQYRGSTATLGTPSASPSPPELAPPFLPMPNDFFLLEELFSLKERF